MKDDWYPDSLGYEDLLKPDVAQALLGAACEDYENASQPTPRVELNIPKKGFVLRYALEMTLVDRLYYQAFATALVPLIDPVLSTSVLNHRFDSLKRGRERYLFKNPIDQWKVFNGYLRDEVVRSPVVVVTDVLNYYENISLEHLKSILNGGLVEEALGSDHAGQVKEMTEDLLRRLPQWCYRRSHGLPQNRDASAVLASLVMLQIDRYMIAKGYAYYRYMDDIRIAVSDKYKARAALQDLSTELRKLGLSLNPSKTDILVPGDEGHPLTRSERDFQVDNIDLMWKARSVEVIRRSLHPLRSLAQALIENGETDTRAFRFCIGRYEKLALCSDLNLDSAYFYPMVEACADQLEDHPYSSDQLVRFLKVAPSLGGQLEKVISLLVDGRKAIYGWQNYLLWQLMVYRQVNDPVLLREARKRAVLADKPADRSGAILYLGAQGTDDDRLLIAKSFKTFDNHLVQRNGLIGVHDLDFHDGIKDYVKPYLLPGFDGVYRRLNREFTGEYFRPFEQIPASELYDEVSPYD